MVTRTNNQQYPFVTTIKMNGVSYIYEIHWLEAINLGLI